MKLVIVLFIGLFALINSTHAQEDKYKALFISQFTKYINWPEPSSKTEIAVLGDTEITKYLREFNEKKKLNFEINKTGKLTGISSEVDLIFISNAKSSLIKQILSKYEGKPVLIVSEKDGLGHKGSAINFVLKDNKIAFEINEKALTSHNLQVASQLKALAINI